MGTLITSKQFQQFLPSTFVFDLEYVGVPNNLNRCYIWEIGIIHVISGTKFSITMDPEIRPLPPPHERGVCQCNRRVFKEQKRSGI